MKRFLFFILKLIEKFWMNPQYFVKLTDPDETDDVDTCTLIVSLMQKFRRKMRTQMKTVQYLNLAIGFRIYCRGITRIHRSPSRPRPAVRPTAVLINIHEHLI